MEKRQTNHDKKPALSSAFISGMLSGTCSTVLFQPLDLLKTRLQEPHSHNQPPKKIWNLATHIVQHEKPTALWRGLVPSLWRCVPGVALYFTSLQYMENMCQNRHPSPSQALVIGAFARTFTGTLLMPTTVIKSRFESGSYAYKSLPQAFGSIYKLEGIPGLFRGLVPTLLRDVPFSALYYLSYTQCKQSLSSFLVTVEKEDLVSFVPLASAVTSGIWAATITQPPDVIKTQMQLFPQKYNGSAVLACRFIFKEFGYKGFFRGLVPRLARRTLMSGATWSLYEIGIRKIVL